MDINYYGLVQGGDGFIFDKFCHDPSFLFHTHHSSYL